MHKILLSSALAALFAAPTMVSAQTTPAALITVVDLEKVTTQCTACKTAQAALQAQVNSLKAREQALVTPLQTEGKAIQAAIDALKGAEPDAALQNRVRAFQTKQQAASTELQNRQQQIQRNQAHITQQIGTKLGPIYRQVMQRRGANIMIEIGDTLASAAALDATNDVLAALNQQLPSVQTVAPAQAPAAQPQGR